MFIFNSLAQYIFTIIQQARQLFTEKLTHADFAKKTQEFIGGLPLSELDKKCF